MNYFYETVSRFKGSPNVMSLLKWGFLFTIFIYGVLTFGSYLRPTNVLVTKENSLTMNNNTNFRVTTIDGFSTSLNNSKTVACVKGCRLPDALIIGAKKCGTRALLEFLRQNQQIVAPIGELHFFDRLFHLGVEYYKSAMPSVQPNQILIEKTTSYSEDELAARRIRSTLGLNASIILVVKNPVDRLLGDYAHEHFKIATHSSGYGLSSFPPNPIYLKPFDEIAFLSSAEDNENFPIVNSNLTIIYPGLYVELLEHFTSLGYRVGRNILIVDGDTFTKNPGVVLLDVQKFLNIKPKLTESSFYINKEKGFPCLKPWELSNFQGSGTTLGLDKKSGCLSSAKGRQHPKITVKQREALVRFYAPHNAKFFKIIGRFFDWA